MGPTLVKIEKRIDALIALALAKSRTGGPSGPHDLNFTVLYVDPQNSTGHASNANPGTLLLPILTTAEVNRRFYLGQLIGNTSVNYLSEDTATVGLDLSATRLGPFGLTVNMTPIVTHTGGTLNAGTIAIDPTAGGGGQRQTGHTTDVANWAPFVFTGMGGTSAQPQRLIDTVTGFSSWVVDGAGGATASLSRPVDQAVAATGPLTIGDGYRLQRPGLLPLAGAPAPSTDGGTLMFNDCCFTASSIGPAQLTGFSVVPTTCNHCASLGPQLFGGSFNDCYLGGGLQGNWIGSLLAGVLLPQGSVDQQTGALDFGGDVYVTGNSALTLGGSFYQTIFVFSGAFGLPIGQNGIQVQSVGSGLPGIQIFEGFTALIGGLLWGNGNAGKGMLVNPGAAVTFQFTPSITGTTGDFGFESIGATHSTGRAWDEGGGVYSAPIATTWANFVAAIGGGGFGQNAHDVAGASSIVQA